jgi:excisionase family DNA binding protein
MMNNAVNVTPQPEPEPDPISDGFATILEAAAFLRVSRSKVYALMDAREVTWAKFGKARRIPWEGLRAYARQQLVVAS